MRECNCSITTIARDPNQASASKGVLGIRPAQRQGYIVALEWPNAPQPSAPLAGAWSAPTISSSSILFAGTLPACTEFIGQYYEPTDPTEGDAKPGSYHPA